MKTEGARSRAGPGNNLPIVTKLEINQKAVLKREK